MGLVSQFNVGILTAFLLLPSAQGARKAKTLWVDQEATAIKEEAAPQQYAPNEQLMNDGSIEDLRTVDRQRLKAVKKIQNLVPDSVRKKMGMEQINIDRLGQGVSGFEPLDSGGLRSPSNFGGLSGDGFTGGGYYPNLFGYDQALVAVPYGAKWLDELWASTLDILDFCRVFTSRWVCLSSGPKIKRSGAVSTLSFHALATDGSNGHLFESSCICHSLSLNFLDKRGFAL